MKVRASSPLSPYQQRALAQAEEWVDGRSEHEPINDECTPDFSCCNPKLFERDRSKRLAYLNAYRARLGLAPRS